MICHIRFKQKSERLRASQVALVVKNAAASVGDIKHLDSIPGLGRSPGGGHGNPLQDSCLGNPMDRGAWRATVHGVTKSDMTEVTKYQQLWQPVLGLCWMQEDVMGA